MIEATAHNLFVRTPDGWITPPVDTAGVRGVMRQLIIEELAPMLAITIDEAPVAVPALRGAREAFICNSNRGVRALGELCELDGAILAQWQKAPQSLALGEALKSYLGQVTGEAL